MIDLLQAAAGLASAISPAISPVISTVLPMASDDSTLWLLAAGPAGGAATYWGFYRYYRNNDKSHAFERDTLIESQPVAGGEDKVDHISRTRESKIDGDNRRDFRQRVRRVP